VKKCEIPEFLRPQTAASLTSSRGLVPYQNKSSYMCDYDITRLDDDAMIGMPPKKNATTRDMFLGTTKATEHPPRYCGHIPQNTFNLRKEEHSSGRTHRPQTCYLRLASERLGSVPNYSGPPSSPSPLLTPRQDTSPSTLVWSLIGSQEWILALLQELPMVASTEKSCSFSSFASSESVSPLNC
jgi:hypothetical protein